MLSQVLSKALEGFPSLREVPGLQCRRHFAQVRAHDAQARDIVIERIERGRLFDQADGFVILGQHRLGVREQRGHVRVGALQRLGDPGLQFDFQRLVQRSCCGC